MSTDFETLLRARLHDETPEPPRDIDPAAPRLRARRDRRQLVAIAAVVMGVLGIALSLVLSRPTPRPAPPAKDPLSSIENVVWNDTKSAGTVVFHRGFLTTVATCGKVSERIRIVGSNIETGRAICLGHRAPVAPPALTTDAKRFYTVIYGPMTWRRNGNTLTLTAASGESVTLRARHGLGSGLLGTRWLLVSYRVSGSSTEYTGNDRLAIAPNASFTDYGAGCPGIAGRVRVRAASIRFKQRLSVVSRGCPGVTAAESALLRALSGHDTYVMRGNELMIDAGKRGFLAYRAVAP